MSDEQKRIVEIQGVKVEVDLREARTVNQFRVGDRVKLLKKSYSGWESHHGVIVAFDEFPTHPTITVAYITEAGDLKFATIHSETEDVEMCAAQDDVLVERGEIIARMDKEIVRKQAELEDLQRKREYFEARFGVLFGDADVKEA